MTKPFDPNVAEFVRKHSALPAERLKLLRPEEVDLARIERGIVFVFAAWSGPCIVGFRKFTAALKGMDLGDLEIVVIDTDATEFEFQKRLFGEREAAVFQGAGEAIWIRAGKVVAFEQTFNASEKVIAEHTRALLQD